MHLRICPAGHFERAVVLPMKLARDLDAVTAHVHDRAAAG
jgi:hypothetical protein